MFVSMYVHAKNGASWDHDCSFVHGWAGVCTRLSQFTDDGLCRLLVELIQLCGAAWSDAQGSSQALPFLLLHCLVFFSTE